MEDERARTKAEDQKKKAKIMAQGPSSQREERTCDRALKAAAGSDCTEALPQKLQRQLALKPPSPSDLASC